MRFNSRNEFNVPFVRKPDRFRKAYITKIVNQIDTIHKIIQGKDWEFKCCDWKEAVKEANDEDFIYADPPYIGRHTNYYDYWTEKEAIELANFAHEYSGGFALSMWGEMFTDKMSILTSIGTRDFMSLDTLNTSIMLVLRNHIVTKC